jgi:hypothetical protein
MPFTLAIFDITGFNDFSPCQLLCKLATRQAGTRGEKALILLRGLVKNLLSRSDLLLRHLLKATVVFQELADLALEIQGSLVDQDACVEVLLRRVGERLVLLRSTLDEVVDLVEVLITGVLVPEDFVLHR